MQNLVNMYVWSAVCLMMMSQSNSSTAPNVGYVVLVVKRTSSIVTPVATV